MVLIVECQQYPTVCEAAKKKGETSVYKLLPCCFDPGNVAKHSSSIRDQLGCLQDGF